MGPWSWRESEENCDLPWPAVHSIHRWRRVSMPSLQKAERLQGILSPDLFTPERFFPQGQDLTLNGPLQTALGRRVSGAQRESPAVPDGHRFAMQRCYSSEPVTVAL